MTHHGKSPGAGHYTADVRQPDARWLRFDDASVTSVPLHQARPSAGPQPSSEHGRPGQQSLGCERGGLPCSAAMQSCPGGDRFVLLSPSPLLPPLLLLLLLLLLLRSSAQLFVMLCCKLRCRMGVPAVEKGFHAASTLCPLSQAWLCLCRCWTPWPTCCSTRSSNDCCQAGGGSGPKSRQRPMAAGAAPLLPQSAFPAQRWPLSGDGGPAEVFAGPALRCAAALLRWCDRQTACTRLVSCVEGRAG